MNWQWVAALGGIAIVACAQASQDENDDDDGGSGGFSGFTTSASGGSTGGATQSVVNSSANSTVSSTVSVVASTVGPGPAVSSSSGGMNCAQELTFEDCANCYCTQDPTGCQAYINLIDTYFYCGAECGTECTLYCSTFNPIDITPTCDTCTFNIDCGFPTTTQMQQDCTNAQNACAASTPCINFVTSLQNCPL